MTKIIPLNSDFVNHKSSDNSQSKLQSYRCHKMTLFVLFSKSTKVFLNIKLEKLIEAKSDVSPIL